MNMRVDFHLVITESGGVRVLKSKPNLNFNEVSIQVRLSIPKAVFQRPQFNAELLIPETAIQSTEVPVELTEQIQQAIEQTTGYEVRLSLVPQGGGES